ncbi:MAG: hypothetical protein ABJA93_06585 [Sporichthyaceae bacterium]
MGQVAGGSDQDVAARTMLAEAERLRAMFVRRRPEEAIFLVGASTSQLDDLRAAFAPMVLPVELIALLSVMDGSYPQSILLGGIGPLLGCAEIAAETVHRRTIADAEGWCPDWVVVTAAGWDFSAVIGGRDVRSPVLDLSYGNRGYQVASASLTALVAASADAWEHELHESQTWDLTPEGKERYLSTRDDRLQLRHAREQQYPSGEGLAHPDVIGPWHHGWPSSWTQPETGVPIYKDSSLDDALDQGGDRTVFVRTTRRTGRWLAVTDEVTEASLDLPPGLEVGRPVHVGEWVRLSVLHSASPQLVPPGLPIRSLLVTGVIPPDRRP